MQGTPGPPYTVGMENGNRKPAEGKIRPYVDQVEKANRLRALYPVPWPSDFEIMRAAIDLGLDAIETELAVGAEKRRGRA